jgi:hypothetical protein
MSNQPETFWLELQAKVQVYHRRLTPQLAPIPALFTEEYYRRQRHAKVEVKVSVFFHHPNPFEQSQEGPIQRIFILLQNIETHEVRIQHFQI